MELELMNIFHLYDDHKCIIIRCNCTKKQLWDELKDHMKDNSMFRHIKFRHHMTQKGYKLYYENMK